MVMMANLDFRESARRPARPAAEDFPSVLTSGGDERLAPDPASGRNRYGLFALPSAPEVYFSSSTASCISPRGLTAASEAWLRLPAARLPEWFGDIRSRVADYCGRPGTDCILSASGTETELLALAITSAALARPITNIVVAPQETGRGVIMAAGGGHFLATAPFAEALSKGARLRGWEHLDILAIGVDIRRGDGELRPAGEVDDEVSRHAEHALSRGRGVIVHLLDVSKTGRGGLGSETAERIRAHAPDRVVVLADCCQLRSSPARMARLLDRGFLLAVTGSKFAGGPPFSAALLVPAALLDGIDRAALPAGLAAYSSVADWPARLMPVVAGVTTAALNFGLGLRWIAALSEMERFKTVPSALTLDIQARFAAETARGAARVKGLRALPPDIEGVAEFAPTIVPVALPAGARGSASALQHALRAPDESGRGFHVGQPVAFGPEVALRVCLGMPMINDVADRVESGQTIEAAFAPVARDLRALFDKWAAL